MKQKEIIEKLQQGYYLKRTIIGYSIDNILLYKPEGDSWIERLTVRQFEALNKKVVFDIDRNDSWINGIGGRITNTSSIEYRFREEIKNVPLS